MADPFSVDYRNLLSGQLGIGDAESRLGQQRQDYQNAILNQQSFADALKKALAGADRVSKVEKERKRGLLEELGNLGSTSRKELGSIKNPFERLRILQERRGNLGTNIDRAGETIALQGGRLEDILGSATGAYETGLQAQQFGLEGQESDLASRRSELSDLLASQQQKQLAEMQIAASAANAANRGPSASDLKELDKQSYNLDFADLANRVSSQDANNINFIVDDPTTGTNNLMTREQAAQALAQRYPAMNYQKILEDIYSAYRSPQEIEKGD